MGSMDRFTLDEILVLTTAMNKLTPNEMQVLVRAVMKLTLDEPSKTAVGGDHAPSSLENQCGKHLDAEFVGIFKRRPANPDADRACASATPPASPTLINQMAMPETPSPSGRLPQMFLPTPESAKTAKPLNSLSVRRSEDQPRKNELITSPPRLKVIRAVPFPPISSKAPRAFSSAKSLPKKVPRVKSMLCNGKTEKGRRCKNKAKAYPPLNVFDPGLSMKPVCHVHRDGILNRNTGFYSGKNGEWVKFEDYIPSYLHSDTRAALRREMMKPPSESDGPGYIYCFAIRDPDAPNIIKLKVGRTGTLQGRLNDWQKQCGSKEQVLRGWWPGNIANKDLQTCLLPDLIEAGEKGPFHGRVERLVHLELADLVVHTPYLNKGFPNVLNNAVGEDGHSNPDTSSKIDKRRNDGATALKTPQEGNKPCPDCGSVHKEIFPFLRPDDSPYKNQEWEKLAKPVIEKWGRFVDAFV